MTGVDAQGLTGARIPDLDGVVPTARGNELTIGRPRQRTHHIFVSFIGGEASTCACIPDLHRAVPTARSNVLTIGRPRHSIYIIAMSMIDAVRIKGKERHFR